MLRLPQLVDMAAQVKMTYSSNALNTTHTHNICICYKISLLSASLPPDCSRHGLRGEDELRPQRLACCQHPGGRQPGV